MVKRYVSRLVKYHLGTKVTVRRFTDDCLFLKERGVREFSVYDVQRLEKELGTTVQFDGFRGYRPYGARRAQA